MVNLALVWLKKVWSQFSEPLLPRVVSTCQDQLPWPQDEAVRSPWRGELAGMNVDFILFFLVVQFMDALPLCIQSMV